MSSELSAEVIRSLSPDQLLSEHFISQILENGIDGDELDLAYREQLFAIACMHAQKLKCKTEFTRVYKAMAKAMDSAIKADHAAKAAKAERDHAINSAVKNSDRPEWMKEMEWNAHGFCSTVDNYLLVLRNDDHFAGLLYNELTYSPETRGVDGKITRWTDAQDAEMRRYIEKNYKIYTPQKVDDAFRIRLLEVKYHPVRDYIRSLKWDGVDRIDQFFQFAVKAPDTPYMREASRLLFAGGINRAFHPACKFDEMIVLVGTKQGEGKSTLVKWLAMQDEWFGEISEIEGQRGIEALEGKWILEVAELLAMVKTKEAEAQKAFITRERDRYRHPFDKRVTEHERQCIFIGTTNKAQFLTDKTGNRRYIPVRVIQTGTEMNARKAEIQEYIRQCWAEALAKIDTPFMQSFIDVNLLDEVREQQENATEDDYREGLISEYINENGIEETCVIEIWEKALNKDANIPGKPSRRDSMDIAIMLVNMGFERNNKPKRTTDYGLQKVFTRKIRPRLSAEDDDSFPPF